jgi:UDP-N-acetylglucosamine 2-epimerase (non-hydrolysing)
MKVASIVEAVKRHNLSPGRRIRPYLVHTGQHYDPLMSAVFFADLGLPAPDVDLGVGSGSAASQTAEIMRRFEPVVLAERPDVVVVVGDVNSTVACALVAAKATYPEPTAATGRTRPLLAHIEGGLRSFDRSMPEELNRIVTDAVSDALFVTEESARRNLLREGASAGRIHLVGNTMVDTLLHHKEKAMGAAILSRLGLDRRGESGAAGRENGAPGSVAAPYALVTLHRPSNVDREETLRGIVEALRAIARELAVVFPAHPRTRKRLEEFGLAALVHPLDAPAPLGDARGSIHCLPPLGYLDFVCLLANAKVVLTDSGGVQDETTVLGVPCVTLRHNTERPVTLEAGTSVLAGTAPADIIRHALSMVRDPPAARRPEFWDGKAGERIVETLLATAFRAG